MSAFIVSKNHVAQLVRFYLAKKTYDDNFDGNDAEVWANKIMAKNVASVNHRYEDLDEKGPVITISDIFKAKDITPVQALKAVRCLNYQSCELEDWERSPEKEFLDKIDDAAIWALPGIEEAAWAID